MADGLATPRESETPTSWAPAWVAAAQHRHRYWGVGAGDKGGLEGYGGDLTPASVVDDPAGDIDGLLTIEPQGPEHGVGGSHEDRQHVHARVGGTVNGLLPVAAEGHTQHGELGFDARPLDGGHGIIVAPGKPHLDEGDAHGVQPARYLYPVLDTEGHFRSLLTFAEGRILEHNGQAELLATGHLLQEVQRAGVIAAVWLGHWLLQAGQLVRHWREEARPDHYT